MCRHVLLLCVCWSTRTYIQAHKCVDIYAVPGVCVCDMRLSSCMLCACVCLLLLCAHDACVLLHVHVFACEHGVSKAAGTLLEAQAGRAGQWQEVGCLSLESLQQISACPSISPDTIWVSKALSPSVLLCWGKGEGKGVLWARHPGWLQLIQRRSPPPPSPSPPQPGQPVFSTALSAAEMFPLQLGPPGALPWGTT